MRILLDTHIALWSIADSNKLSDTTIKIIESPDNEIYYSLASVWEIAIKHKLHPDRIQMSEDIFVKLCEDTGFDQLPITVEQIYQIKTLSRPIEAPPHNDPFDRIILAQAKQEKMKFITHDSLIPWYNEPFIILPRLLKIAMFVFLNCSIYQILAYVLLRFITAEVIIV